jgi:hypothetical protein
MAASSAPQSLKAVFGSEKPLPITVDGLTAAWFGEALGWNVTGVAIKKEIRGTASKIIVELEHADSGNGLPTRLCVKGGFNPELMRLVPAVLTCYRLEAEFYYYIAPKTGMNLPTTYFCGTDVVNGQGLVIMEDLESSTFGTVLEPWTAERVREGVKELALLHAKTWGGRTEDFPWYKTNGIRDAIESLWAPAAWQERFSTEACPPIHDELKDRHRVVGAFHTMWNTPDPRFVVMAHGDSHVANTFITASGKPGFLDFQGVHPDSAFMDVAYFITGAMEIEDRCKHEHDLVQSYLDALAEAGGPRFAVEDAWEEFRRQQLHGFVWSLATPMLQPKHVVDPVSARHAAAIMDHKSLELIESHPEYKPLVE